MGYFPGYGQFLGTLIHIPRGNLMKKPGNLSHNLRQISSLMLETQLNIAMRVCQNVRKQINDPKYRILSIFSLKFWILNNLMSKVVFLTVHHENNPHLDSRYVFSVISACLWKSCDCASGRRPPPM